MIGAVACRDRGVHLATARANYVAEPATCVRLSPHEPQVHTSERGRVDLVQVLAAAKGDGVAEMDEDMEHRRMAAC